MRDCGDCNAKPGEFHQPGCDVERCRFCGGQMISCGCIREAYGLHEEEPTDEQFEAWEKQLAIRGLLPWTGEWPGAAECREYGWYSCWAVLGDPTKGHVRCAADHPDAHPDLNRLVVSCTWDPEAKRWVRQT